MWACPVQKPGAEEPEKPKTIFWVISNYFETFTALKVTAFILTLAMIIFFGWMFVCRSQRKSTFSYNNSESGSSDLSHLDDLSVDEFETNQNINVYMPSGRGLTSPPVAKLPRKTYQSFHPLDNKII
mmetsp:Transcript_12479/g.17739  ORF Transcript_12479/g.17739 Transcript_12479/m.17739 type:complete len:127 (-) Transcript_12479:78-458(-)